MAKFKQSTSKKEVPAISTASLPDVVFMLLFFFMVSTSMRETDLRVSVSVPSASEVQKLEKKSLVSYIYIGTPLQAYQGLYGNNSRIQLNDSFKTLDDIRDFISSERDAMKESERSQMTTSLKIDELTRMGIVSEVKQELRKSAALKIVYAARKSNE